MVGQSPNPNAEVERGSTVTAEINVGPATTKIPDDLVGRDLDEALEELADAGFVNVKAVPVDNPPEDAEPDEVVAVEPAEGKRAALEEDIVVSYVGRVAESATTGPTAGGAPTTKKDRSPTEQESEDEPDDSGSAKEPTRSSSAGRRRDNDHGRDGHFVEEPTETATEPTAPASSAEPSGAASGEPTRPRARAGPPFPAPARFRPGARKSPSAGAVESINP